MKKWRIQHLDWIPLLLIAFVLFKLVFTADVSMTGALDTVYSCVSYFIYGLLVAYFLNPLVSNIEKRLTKTTEDRKKQNIKRGIIIAVVYLLVFGIIAIFVGSIVPAIADGLQDFFDNFQTYLAKFQNWSNDYLVFISPELRQNISEGLSDIASSFADWLATGMDMNKVGGVVSNVVSNSAKFVINFVFAIVVSVYFLYGKEKLLNHLKRFTYALFSVERAERVINCAGQINKIFYDFILSKIVQAFVFFIMGLVVLMPLNVPFAALISLVLAVGNMIPYIGPWLGSIPCLFLVVLYNPIKALILLIFILAMQIVDNVFIGPKITAERVGISPLLVIAGVAIGGTLGGIIGMFIGVPIVAVIKLVFYDSFVERRLKEKNLDI